MNYWDCKSKQFERAFQVKKIDTENRRVRVLASDDTLDRDGERVLPSAFAKHLDKYKKTQSFLLVISIDSMTENLL